MADTGLSPTTRSMGSDELLQNAPVLDQIQSEVFAAGDPVPVPPDIPGMQFRLPGGFIDVVGEEVIRDVTIRELNGEDEEILAKQDHRKNMGKYLTVLLSRGVVQIGELPASTERLQSMLLGDRDYLVIKIRSVTYGNEVEMSVVCPNCEQTNEEVVIDLDTDVAIKEIGDDERQWDLELPSGLTAKVRLPIGHDQEEMLAGSSRKTLPEMNTALLTGCVLQIGANPMVDIKDVRRLSAKDRRFIVKHIADNAPGPVYDDMTVPCAYCGGEFPVALGHNDLFRGW